MTDEVTTNGGQSSGVAEYSPIEAAIARLRQEYTGRVYDVTTTAGMTSARTDRATIRKTRTELEKIRKEIKAPALQRCRDIDAEAKRLTAAILEFEKPLDDLIKAEEEKKAAERAAREKAERDRIQAIHERINDLRFILSEYHPSHDIKQAIDVLEGVTITEEVFGEFALEAARVHGESLEAAHAAYRAADAREQKEAEDREARRQAEEAAREQAKKEEAARLEAEEKLREEREARAREDAEREDAAEKTRQEEQARQDAEREERAKLEARRREEEQVELRRRQMAEAKCVTQNEALWRISEICTDDLIPSQVKVEQIFLIAQANTDERE